MDKKEHDKITAFDTLFTTNHIQILKIVMSWLDNRMQKKLAVYIKFLELQYTLSWFSSHPFELCGCSIQKEEFSVPKLCSEILPYCTSEEKQKVEQIAGMFRSMEMYREMSQTFEMMKDIFPEGFGDSFFSDKSNEENSNAGADSDGGTQQDGGTFGSRGMLDMLMNMLSPEQKAMFEMFGGDNSHESE